MTILYKKSHHAHNGLHRCSHNLNTFTSCTTSRSSQDGAITHWGSTTLDHVVTSFIRRYPSLLQIPTHPHFDCRWTVPTTHWCTHTGLCPAAWNIWSLQLSNTSQNFSACYNIDSKYLGITYDKRKSVEISEQQFSICQKANRQFCSIDAPFQPIANPPPCIAAICTKNKGGIEKRCSLKSGTPIV